MCCLSSWPPMRSSVPPSPLSSLMAGITGLTRYALVPHHQLECDALMGVALPVCVYPPLTDIVRCPILGGRLWRGCLPFTVMSAWHWAGRRPYREYLPHSLGSTPPCAAHHAHNHILAPYPSLANSRPFHWVFLIRSLHYLVQLYNLGLTLVCCIPYHYTSVFSNLMVMVLGPTSTSTVYWFLLPFIWLWAHPIFLLYIPS